MARCLVKQRDNFTFTFTFTAGVVVGSETINPLNVKKGGGERDNGSVVIPECLILGKKGLAKKRYETWNLQHQSLYQAGSIIVTGRKLTEWEDGKRDLEPGT
jgi:hypothetical protein